MGEEAECCESFLSLQYPVRRGMITHWDDMEAVWHHAFYNQLGTSPQKHPVLMTETPSSLHHRGDREKMTQILFETFDCPAFYVAVQVRLWCVNIVEGFCFEIFM